MQHIPETEAELMAVVHKETEYHYGTAFRHQRIARVGQLGSDAWNGQRNRPPNLRRPAVQCQADLSGDGGDKETQDKARLLVQQLDAGAMLQ